MRTTTTTNPVFAADEFALHLGDPARVEQALHDPHSVDLLTWNVFWTLARHRDQDWLAALLGVFTGGALHPPVRVGLWTGRAHEPLLRPNANYLATVKQRVRSAGADEAAMAEALRPFTEALEAPVRIESADVLCLVDPVLDEYPLGAGGRDRLVELIDAGLDAAHRVGKRLAVAAVHPGRTRAGGEVAARVQELQDPAALRAALPHRDGAIDVTVQAVTWEDVLRLWDAERDWLPLDGEPVRDFLRHCATLGLR